MAINRVDIKVVLLSQIQLVHVAELEDGCFLFCTQNEAYYTLKKNPVNPTTVDGVSVIRPAPGSPIAGNPNALWIRSLDGVGEEFANQATWFVDPVNGSDANKGDTSLVPTKTFAEIRTRIGSTPISAASWSLVIMGDLPESDPVILDFHIGPTVAAFTVTAFGTTQLYSGTISNKVANSPATNVQLQIAVVAGSGTPAFPASWTLGPYVSDRTGSNSKRIRFTSGPAINELAWGPLDQGLLAGNPSIRIGVPEDPITLSQAEPLVGDTFVIEQLIKVACLKIDLKIDTNVGAAVSELTPKVSNLAIGNGIANAGAATGNDSDLWVNATSWGMFNRPNLEVDFLGCQLPPPISGGIVVGCYACHVFGQREGIATSGNGPVYFDGCVFTTVLFVVGGYMDCSHLCLFQGQGNVSSNFGNNIVRAWANGYLGLNDVGIFNPPGGAGSDGIIRSAISARTGGVVGWRAEFDVGSSVPPAGIYGTSTTGSFAVVDTFSAFITKPGLAPTFVGSVAGVNDVRVAGVVGATAAPMTNATNLAFYGPEAL